MSGLVLQ